MKLENEAISNEFFCEGTAKLIKTIWVMRVLNLLFFISLLIIWNTPNNLELKSKKAFVLIYVIYIIFFMIEREIRMKKIVKLYDEKILPKFGKRILKTIKYTNNGKIGINRYQDSGLFKNKKRVDFEETNYFAVEKDFGKTEFSRFFSTYSSGKGKSKRTEIEFSGILLINSIENDEYKAEKNPIIIKSNLLFGKLFMVILCILISTTAYFFTPNNKYSLGFVLFILLMVLLVLSVSKTSYGNNQEFDQNFEVNRDLEIEKYFNKNLIQEMIELGKREKSEIYISIKENQISIGFDMGREFLSCNTFQKEYKTLWKDYNKFKSILVLNDKIVSSIMSRI